LSDFFIEFPPYYQVEKKETPLSNSEGEMNNNLRYGPVNQENQFESQGQMQDFILINLS
jgi:hypothetical protein